MEAKGKLCLAKIKEEDTTRRIIEASRVEFNNNVKDSLLKIIAREGFTNYREFSRILTTNGNSYLGNLYEVNIKGETNDGFKEIDLFIKQSIDGKSVIDVKTCYLHEIFVYNELSEIFDVLQRNVSMPEGENFKVAKSYECISEAIFLENLVKKGFKTLNKMDIITLKIAELSITQLAKFHGLGFVLKYKKSNFFEKKITAIKSACVFDDIILWQNYLKTTADNVTTHFDSHTKLKISNFVENSMFKKFPKYLTGATDSVKCLCHGDFKHVNVLVKENSEEETEVMLIDYQFLLYGSPVIDLIYFFYMGTDRQFRKAHMNNLKNLYHNKLTEFLKYFEIDINDVYPKGVYENDFVDCLDYGLMVALFATPVIFAIDDSLEFGTNTEDVSYKLDNRYKQRITEVVEEYLEWGILK